MSDLFGLWEHQEKAVAGIEAAWQSGIKSVCLQMPTGSGKSRVIRQIVDNHYESKKVIYLIAHRDTLVRQLSEEVSEAGIKHGIIQPNSPMLKYRVQVCSMQTLVRRLEKLPDPDIIIIDECFVPGTIIDGYGAIDKAKKFDIIKSYDTEKKEIVNSMIYDVKKRIYEKDLYSINGIVCTENHPFYTDKGWVRAKEINLETKLLCDMWKKNNETKKNLFKRMSFSTLFRNNVKNKRNLRFRKNEEKKSYVQKRDERKVKQVFNTDRTQTKISRRKRKANSRAGFKIIFKNKKRRFFLRGSNTDKNAKTFCLSNMLQSRYCKQQNKAWNRNRWRIACGFISKTKRQEKRGFLKFVRVDDIKILKFGSDEWNKKMCGENYVYNIEVERTECYFVEGILVHNCHHSLSASYLKILQRWNDAKILGVTATPERLSGEPLADVFQKLITVTDIPTLIDQKKLSPFDYFAPETIDISGAHSQNGDYKISDIAEKVDRKAICGSAVDHYKRHADGRPAIVCCANIKHAENVSAEFVLNGYRAVAVHSKMNGVDEAIEGLKKGSIDVLCQCDLLSEGVDIKGAEVLIMLRHTKSIVIFLQQVGRVLRYLEGKKAIILDHVGNWERHGLPDDFREWSLFGKSKKGESSEHKRCPDCQRPVKKTERICPYCGHSWVETVEKGTRELPEQIEGTLVQITESRKLKNAAVLAIVRNAKSLAEAVNIGKKHGISSKHAWFVWVKMMKKSA